VLEAEESALTLFTKTLPTSLHSLFCVLLRGAGNFIGVLLI
jgi:hypothetical protein